ncbi:large ribosomal subunit protein mL52-like [Babylonia areolata]|uniref:large ribosomal subunit protein mL52-like n=1 Tax=Babylonia areolata TaxID=304850 RepID=UPI003FD41408
MACSRCSALFQRAVSVRIPSASRHVSTTIVLQGKRRKEPALRKWGLENFPREDRSRQRSALYDLPDFTYLDGRPTPLTKEQLEKKEKNYHLAKRIVMLVNEMEQAKSTHLKRIEAEDTRRKDIIGSKLKQKSNDL